MSGFPTWQYLSVEKVGPPRWVEYKGQAAKDLEAAFRARQSNSSSDPNVRFMLGGSQYNPTSPMACTVDVSAMIHIGYLGIQQVRRLVGFEGISNHEAKRDEVPPDWQYLQSGREWRSYSKQQQGQIEATTVWCT